MLMDGGEPFRYILMLALAMLFHFYMGYMICLFVALYACYYASPLLAEEGSWKEKLGAFAQLIKRGVIYSILAIFAVFFLLYPIFLNLLRSKGAYECSMTFDWGL